MTVTSNISPELAESEPVRCGRCERKIYRNRVPEGEEGGWFAYPANHLAVTCDGLHFHVPAIS